MSKCESCPASKATAKPFGKASRASSLLEILHSDICGPINVKACHWAIYFLTFIDDYSRCGYVYILSHRYEATDVFKHFVAEGETQLEQTIKNLRTNRGCEYLSNIYKEFCEEKGMRRKITIPDTPQQNDVTEYRN